MIQQDAASEAGECASVGHAFAGGRGNGERGAPLAALAEAYGLPASAPLTLFAIARSVGWIAHMLEQVQRGGLIRPRAHYDGPAIRVD